MLAFHGIFSAYGFWLPNDPRGSWSIWVAAWELFRFGPATKTSARHSVAHVEHDHERRRAAKQALKFAPVVFNDDQIRSLATGIANVAQSADYKLYALAIMPTHIHVVATYHDLIGKPAKVNAPVSRRPRGGASVSPDYSPLN